MNSDVIFKKMTEWRFPADTCEVHYKYSNNISQLYSFSANICILVMLIYQLSRSNNRYIGNFILSLILFEIIHAYSHYSYNTNIDLHNIIHYIAYLVMICLLYLFKYLTKKPLTNIQYLILYALFIIDIGINICINGMFQVISGTAIILYILNIYIRQIPPVLFPTYTDIVYTIIISIFILGNEIVNCDSMIKFQNLPYHIIVEIVLFILLYLYTEFFIKWSTIKTANIKTIKY